MLLVPSAHVHYLAQKPARLLLDLFSPSGAELDAPNSSRLLLECSQRSRWNLGCSKRKIGNSKTHAYYQITNLEAVEDRRLLWAKMVPDFFVNMCYCSLLFRSSLMKCPRIFTIFENDQNQYNRILRNNLIMTEIRRNVQILDFPKLAEKISAKKTFSGPWYHTPRGRHQHHSSLVRQRSRKSHWIW